MKVTLHHGKRLGLEVWTINRDGTEIHSFLSERIARTKFERIRMQMERSNSPEDQNKYGPLSDVTSVSPLQKPIG